MMLRMLSAGLLVISGCATPLMTEEACLAGAWREAGFEDGTAGKRMAVFEDRAALCAEAGAPADDFAIADYRSGRNMGLDRLCTHRGGYDFGLAGSVYDGVCPAASEQDFLAGYFPARRIEWAQRNFDGAESSYNAAVTSRESLRDAIERARATLADPEAKEKAVKRARKTLDNAEPDRRNARDNIRSAEFDLEAAREELGYVERTSAAWSDSAEFYALLDVRMEVHAFARASDAIDHCTEYRAVDEPVCYLRAGQILVAESGTLCAAGPGEVRFRARAPIYEGAELSGFRHAFDVHALDKKGRAVRRATGFFEAFFDADGNYQSVGCARG